MHRSLQYIILDYLCHSRFQFGAQLCDSAIVLQDVEVISIIVIVFPSHVLFSATSDLGSGCDDGVRFDVCYERNA